MHTQTHTDMNAHTLSVNISGKDCNTQWNVTECIKVRHNDLNHDDDKPPLAEKQKSF